MRKSTSPFLTGSPSRKFTATICPSTRALSATVRKASTLPMACSRIGTVSCTAIATVTGTVAGPLAALPPSFARVSVLKYAATPPTATATSKAPAIRTRRRALVIRAAELSSRNPLGRKQFLGALAAAHQVRFPARHEHFGGARPRVVVRAHRHAVGASRHERHEIAFPQCQAPLLGEEIRALAHRPYHVANSARLPGLRFAQRPHIVPSAVEGRPDEVVHPGVEH